MIEFRLQTEIFPQRVQQMIDDPNGPVSLRVKAAAEAVHDQASRNVGSTYPGHHARRRLKDSGEVAKGAQGNSWIVAFKHPIALLHHEGSAAHSIGAPGKILYRKGPGRVTSWGATIFFRKQAVNHPGTTGNPFLTNAVEQVGLQRSGALKRGKQGPFPIARIRRSI